MVYLLRGALIEYGTDFLVPIKNVVIFQFNPETLIRDIQIPPRSTDIKKREKYHASDTPVEKITLTAHFSAADQLNTGDAIAVMFGIGPRLAALEKMVYPGWKISDLAGAAIDAIGDTLGIKNKVNPEEPVPRQQYPRILFIWGMTRVLPVLIESMKITEQQYDSILNPIQAEVSLGLAVLGKEEEEDGVAFGAIRYSNLTKEAQAVANLAKTAKQVVDLIPI